jgi:hypothetical protein
MRFDDRWIMLCRNCVDVLVDVLYYLIRLKPSRYFRIAALCIDQNELREDNLQVAI